MNLVVTVTIRCTAPMDGDLEEASALGDRIEDAVWTGLRPLELADALTDVSHVDVEVDPETER